MHDVVEPVKLPLLLCAVAVHSLILIGLSSCHRRSNHPVLRFLLSSASAAYFPLIYYVLSQMSTFLSSMLSPSENGSSNHDDDDDDRGGTGDLALWMWLVLLVLSLISVQVLKAKADMAALAVAAVTSPVAGDDIDSVKIRPSIDSLINSFWVAGLVVFSLIRYKDVPFISDSIEIKYTILLIAPLWILGACRMVLRSATFEMATRSFAHGRNVELIDGYMAWLQQQRGFFDEHLIVTGERNEDVEETPLGYRVKPSVVQESVAAGRGSLITVDRVRSHESTLVGTDPELSDLCLSFALFKCPRRRFAGHGLTEAGSSWAIHFVCDGLLRQLVMEDDSNYDKKKHDCKRVFQLIANELSFARDFYYSPLPVASLGSLPAALHFFLSSIITVLFCFLTPLLLVAAMVWPNSTSMVAFLLVVVNAITEITDIVTSVRSNWTKISIIGQCIRCRQGCLRKIFNCLLRCKSGKQLKHQMGQTKMLKPSHFWEHRSWAHACFNRLSNYLGRKKTHSKPKTKVPPEVEVAILSSFKKSDGQLRDGTAAVRRRWQVHDNDITWPCYGGEVTHTTDLLLVWHVATSLFKIRSPSPGPASISSSTETTKNIAIAKTLSRYCAYLVAEAPELLPDDSAWTKLRYEEVKKGIEKASCSSNNSLPKSELYEHLIRSFSAESSAHELLKKGARLGAQLVEAAGDKEARPGGKNKVWELLAEFWSEMVLYLAPCDNVKRHLEALQRGGEFVMLLWVLLLHAGITSRPTRQVTEPRRSGIMIPSQNTALSYCILHN